MHRLRFPILHNLHGGQSCCIEHCRNRSAASQRLVFRSVLIGVFYNFLTFRNAVKDMSELIIQFFLNFHYYVYGVYMCKRFGLMSVHV